MRQRIARLCWLTALCVGVGVLVGLSPSFAGDRQTTIKAWVETGTFDQYYPEMMETFEKKNPDIKVDWFVFPWVGHIERYSTAIATGTLPDTGATYVGLFATWLYPRNILLPLDDFMGEGGVTKDNIPAIEDLDYLYKGNVYAIPFVYGIYIYAQNVDMFKRAGVPLMPQDHPLSYEEYVEISEKLTKDFNGDGVPDQYASAYPGTPAPGTGDDVFPIFRTAGVEVIEDNEFGLNNPTGLKALKWLINYGKKYSPLGTAGMDRPEVKALFNEGIVAVERTAYPSRFFTEWPESYPDLNVEPAMPPRWNKAEGTGYGCADAYGIFKSSKNPELTWRFLQYFFSKENEIFATSKTGRVSCRRDVGGKYIPMETDFAKRVMEVTERQAPFAKGEERHPAYAEAYEIALSEIQAARLGIKSPEKALSEAEKKVNEVLKKYEGF